MPTSKTPESAAYGGQAVVEGVMIRGARRYAVAVRAPAGGIEVHAEAVPAVVPGGVRRIPILRGILALYETLALGLRALTWSSQIAAGVQPQAMTSGQLWLTLTFMLAFLGGVFFAAPVLLTAWVGGVAGNAYAAVAAEGALRVLMLLAYVWAIGRLRDIRRVFQYHAAEHRAIHAHEAGRPLVADEIRSFPNAHPRCGTAFLLTVVVLAMLVFLLLGTPPIWVRLVERVALVPVVAALAYEVLRLGQRFGSTPIIRWLFLPSLWLQALTTRDPDDAQIEVAVASLERVLQDEAATAVVAP